MSGRAWPVLLLAIGVAACARAPAPQPAPPAVPPPVSAPPATELVLTRPPTLPPPRPLTPPPIAERRLANGLRLLVVEHHELPVVELLLVVRTGAEADPVGRAGLATLTADLLDEGAGGRGALEVADQVAYLGARLETWSRWDASVVALHGPTARLDSALALVGDVVLRPAFAEAELRRLREERLTTLMQLRDEGPAVADRAFPQIVYGGAHPYGRPLIGTEASTRAITRGDVQRFHETYYRPNNATVIVVGDVRADDVERRLARLLGAWPAAAVPAVPIAAPPPPPATRVYLVDRPGAAQSSVRIGAPGVARSTADYFPLLVLNTVLGGSFTSRLNQNLREVHGYTYGAGSSFSMRRGAGPFVAGAEIVAASTDSALLEFRRELRAIRDTVPMAELEKARRYLQLQLPGSFETPADIAGQLLPIALHELPLDYFAHYAARIGQVTQADVQRVARRYVDPARMAIVVVGDRSVIEPGIRASGVAPVVLQPVPPR